MELLRQVPLLPSDILQIVGQHHENCSGTGYPLHLKGSRIHPLARIVAVANAFCELAIRGPNGPGLAPDEAFERLRDHGEDLDASFVAALARVMALKAPQETAA
jgi:HD-GYP domain-containing protein (c-di-GMP phosphodiesterase class II)